MCSEGFPIRKAGPHKELSVSDLHFPVGKDIFICVLAISVFSLDKYLFKLFAHLKIILFDLLLLSCVLYISWIQVPYHIYDLQIFFSILWLPFHFLHVL